MGELMMGSKSFIFRFADVEVREREFSLIKAGEPLPVEPKAFRVLLFLLRKPQKLIAKEELLNAVWGDASVTENSLTRSIALLRRLHPPFPQTRGKDRAPVSKRLKRLHFPSPSFLW